MRPKKAKTPFFHYLYDPEIRSTAQEEHEVKGKELTSGISAQRSQIKIINNDTHNDKLFFVSLKLLIS